MPRYLISFNEGDMIVPEAELPAVAEAAHEVLRAAKAAGVWVSGGGVLPAEETVVVAVDGTVSHGPGPGRAEFLGGFSILDVASREEALDWAARLAVACRCAQEVRELMHDPEA